MTEQKLTEWRLPGLYKGINSDLVYEEINEIEGKKNPKNIVEKARDENTELHKCFEWDDTIAGEKYRLYQARKLTSCLIIYREKKNQHQ